MDNGIWPSGKFSIVDSLVVSAIAIVLVFLVLTIIILITHAITYGTDKVESKMEIKPRKENHLLDEDPDAIIAALTATIDFNKETGKNARLVKIKRIIDKGE